MPEEVFRLTTKEGAVVATQVKMATNSAARAKGLLGRTELAEGEGLCIKPCNSIHMFFMRMPLDVVFVDGKGKVLHICHSIKPWRMSKMVLGAKAAIELAPGTLKKAGVEVGLELLLSQSI